MKTHNVTLVATEGIFKGLAKQNMLFHQCIGELCDNSIAATPNGGKFRIDIVLVPEPHNRDYVTVFVADDTSGMSLAEMERALQLGEMPTSSDRLNEHGFGLKNALATLSGDNGPWTLWTRKKREARSVYEVSGPFRQNMKIREVQGFPQIDFVPTEDVSTLIKVRVKMSFLQTVQGRGAPARDLYKIRNWLVEHLGVFYRGYLEQDPASDFEAAGSIYIAIGNDRVRVPPINVPIGDRKVEYFTVELGGEEYSLEYRCGTLDTEKCKNLVRGEPAKYYYQGNMRTQGIDIRLGKRVIATRQFETIWKTENGEEQLSRHNNYNDFVGELLIPDLPRGILSTTNNKTDFNLDDPGWQVIFDELNRYRPPKSIREKSEKEITKKWIEMLKATNPDESITDDYRVWPTGTRIDVYRESQNNKIIIYEVKTGTGSPIHLYQLKMYWDGLVMEGKQAHEAVLLVEDFHTNLEEMANMMNAMTPPKYEGQDTRPYNFRIEKLRDKGL